MEGAEDRLACTAGTGNRRIASGEGQDCQAGPWPLLAETFTLLSPTLSCFAKCLPLAEINSWQGNLENWAAWSTEGRCGSEKTER